MSYFMHPSMIHMILTMMHPFIIVEMQGIRLYIPSPLISKVLHMYHSINSMLFCQMIYYIYDVSQTYSIIYYCNHFINFDHNQYHILYFIAHSSYDVHYDPSPLLPPPCSARQIVINRTCPKSDKAIAIERKMEACPPKLMLRLTKGSQIVMFTRSPHYFLRENCSTLLFKGQ